MIQVNVWPKGYADFGGTISLQLPEDSTDLDIQNAVRGVNNWASLSSVIRPRKADPFLDILTQAQLNDYANAFKGDNN